MRSIVNERNILGALALAFAGVAPNLFPAAQAGVAKMSFLATRLLIPSIVGLAVVWLVAWSSSGPPASVWAECPGTCPGSSACS